MKKETRIFAALIFSIFSMLVSTPALAITYQVDRTIGTLGSVTGIIETDGTLGGLFTANIVDWDLNLTIDTTTENYTPSTGLTVFTTLINVTSTEMTWERGGNSSAVVGFCAPINCSSGTRWLIFGNGIEQLFVTGEPTQDNFFPIGPDEVIATTVPVPAAAWLFGSALGLLGWMRRKAT